MSVHTLGRRTLSICVFALLGCSCLAAATEASYRETDTENEGLQLQDKEQTILVRQKAFILNILLNKT
jgi:hypothetical protein